VAPGVTWDDVAGALADELPPHTEAELDAATLTLAQRFAPEHLG
jgi:hypothetical protein